MKYQSELYNLTKEIDWENVAPGMNRKFMGYNDEIMMVQVKFDKGGIGIRHKHRHSQTTYVVSGKFEVSIGDEKKILEGGDGFCVPPNIEHGAVCLEDGMLIDVFSPIREDFMKGKSGYTK
ncbi:MAG: cupin domain-containing protein [Bacteroidetes bacterium]|nr:cupin domain-containing protein [Bacteroidota bacterium]MBU1680110.1 cupin domain-containing protein [Bacteroidota bacterium]MBU2506786.1 cupin domain-containing protein [Bacteroidota bacterium]